MRLYQVELEHYEKIEGTQLTLDGKANRLATMIRGNLGAGDAGAGRRAAVRRLRPRRRTDGRGRSAGRIFSFDVAGGRYPEQYYHSSARARCSPGVALKKLWRPGWTAPGAVRVVVEALYDAADDDSATGGPDMTRGIFPVVCLATAEGTRRLPTTNSARLVRDIVGAPRTTRLLTGTPEDTRRRNREEVPS